MSRVWCYYILEVEEIHCNLSQLYGCVYSWKKIRVTIVSCQKFQCKSGDSSETEFKSEHNVWTGLCEEGPWKLRLCGSWFCGVIISDGKKPRFMCDVCWTILLVAFGIWISNMWRILFEHNRQRIVHLNPCSNILTLDTNSTPEILKTCSFEHSLDVSPRSICQEMIVKMYSAWFQRVYIKFGSQGICHTLGSVAQW